jgi:dihydroneopterin triphosphate diphosphatase
MGKKSGKKVQVHVYCDYAESGIMRFLVLKKSEARGGYWQPITGNVDDCEELEDCVRRELAEETGINNLTSCSVIDDFSYTKNGQNFHETVYLARVPACDIRLSKEHAEFRWEPYETARDLILYESNKQALDKAFKVLRSTV